VYKRQDPSRLRQAIIAIVGNAAKFTDQGSVDISVTRLKESDALSIRVSDTGIGIPEENLEDIFHPFFQVESHLSRQYGGTGLGLAIARNIIDLLGGSIDASSHLGQGTTFTIKLPIKDANSEAALKRIDGKAILVVSDKSHLRDAIQYQLEQWGSQVQTQSTAPKKLATTLEQNTFDFIIADDSATRPDTLEILQSKPIPPLLRIGFAESPDLAKLQSAQVPSWLKPSSLNRALYSLISKSNSDARKNVTKNSGATAPKKKKYDPEFASNHPLQILVVEDNPINTKVLVNTLRKLGYEASAAANGKEGYLAAEESPFDFIFMDLQMPVMDGLESAKRILNSEKIKHPIYISAFTANAHQTDRDACDSIGFHDFVSKPARPDKITEVLKRAYAWKKGKTTA